jgi:hypothetical protein
LKLFTLCNIESAHRMPDNWCKLFASEDFDVMSYLNDLKGYWVKGYGNKLNSKMVFLLLKDLFTEMEKHMHDDPKKYKVKKNLFFLMVILLYYIISFFYVLRHKILLRFGHAENVFPLVTALELFKDDHELTSANFIENLNRRFKSAVLTPFSSNLAFVLHRCNKLYEEEKNAAPAIENNNGEMTTNSIYKVSILVNELPVAEINAGKLKCHEKNANNRKYKNDGSLCDYVDFKNQMSDYIGLEFEDVCMMSAAKLDETKLPSGDINENTVKDSTKVKMDL